MVFRGGEKQPANVKNTTTGKEEAGPVVPAHEENSLLKSVTGSRTGPGI
jgi:hypothetical protein